LKAKPRKSYSNIDSEETKKVEQRESESLAEKAQNECNLLE
jgi:hypothetical protein